MWRHFTVVETFLSEVETFLSDVETFLSSGDISEHVELSKAA